MWFKVVYRPFEQTHTHPPTYNAHIETDEVLMAINLSHYHNLIMMLVSNFALNAQTNS